MATRNVVNKVLLLLKSYMKYKKNKTEEKTEQSTCTQMTCNE